MSGLRYANWAGGVHCWQDGPRVGEDWEHPGIGSTCLLPEGHDGPHEFTPDNEIQVTFAGPEPSVVRSVMDPGDDLPDPYDDPDGGRAMSDATTRLIAHGGVLRAALDAWPDGNPPIARNIIEALVADIDALERAEGPLVLRPPSDGAGAARPVSRTYHCEACGQEVER